MAAAGLAHRRGRLRRRHAGRRAARRARAGRHRPDQPGHAAHRDPPAPRELGAHAAAPPVRRRRRAAHVPAASSARTSPTCSGACCASRASTGRARSSSAPPPPSATRASTPRACSACRTDEVELVDESGAPRGERRFFLFNPPVVNAELGHPRELREAGGHARGGPRARARADDRLRAVAELASRSCSATCATPWRRGRAHRRGRRHRPDAHHGLPRRVPARAAARHRAAAARGRDPRASSRPTRSSSGSTSASSTRSSAPATRARSRRRGSASGAPGGGASRASACSSRRARRSISTSRASRSYLLGAPVEEARIDPDNVEILVQHLKCAAFELPFKRGEAFGSLGAEETARGARVPRAPPRASRVGRHVPLGGRRLPGQRRVAPERRLGQRRHHRRRARQVASPSSTGAPRTRCCTSRPSTSTTASAGRSSASTTRTTRRSSARSSPTTGPTR